MGPGCFSEICLCSLNIRFAVRESAWDTPSQVSPSASGSSGEAEMACARRQKDSHHALTSISHPAKEVGAL